MKNLIIETSKTVFIGSNFIELLIKKTKYKIISDEKKNINCY